MLVVSNATPLIALDAAHALHLLPALYTEIHIPEAIYAEVVVAGAGRAGAVNVSDATWIVRHAVGVRVAANELKTKRRLGAGESETLVLAQELRADLVLLDDRAARRAARQLTLPVRGTVGVLLMAKKSNLIPAIRPLLDGLRGAGIYLDETLYQRALQLAGE